MTKLQNRVPYFVGVLAVFALVLTVVFARAGESTPEPVDELQNATTTVAMVFDVPSLPEAPSVPTNSFQLPEFPDVPEFPEFDFEFPDVPEMPAMPEFPEFDFGV